MGRRNGEDGREGARETEVGLRGGVLVDVVVCSGRQEGRKVGTACA